MSTISKADVLETFADLYDVFEDNKAIRKELDKVYDRLNALPSAQSRLCEDTVSRNAVFDAIEDVAWEVDASLATCQLYDCEKDIDTAMEISEIASRWYKFICNKVRMIPSVTPKQQWIPCSETVDIPDHEVLACDKYGEELIGWLLYSDDQWLCESDGEMMYDPIAWREKPEPYKERWEE